MEIPARNTGARPQKRVLILIAVLAVIGSCFLSLPVPRRAGAGPRPALLPAGIVPQGNGYICRKDGMPMVLVPAGAFTMGSNSGCYDERPEHRVYLAAYLMDQHEVTNAQFDRFVRDSGRRAEGPWKWAFKPGTEQHPVRFVTWYDAQAYAHWAGRQLPTEAQWEKAARGADGRTYPWGPAWQAGMARAGAGVEAGPVAVGSCPRGASPYGCLDMAGNVWEWVADWYDRYYYENPNPNAVARNPIGPPDGAPPEVRFEQSNTASGNERSTRKVIRGGGWAGEPDSLRCARRMWGNPRYWLDDTGFRCAARLDGTP